MKIFTIATDFPLGHLLHAGIDKLLEEVRVKGASATPGGGGGGGGRRRRSVVMHFD
jgi:hypothetical protein